MARMRRRSSGRPARGSKWLGGGAGQASANVDNAVTVTAVLPAASIEGLVDPTIVRVRGNIIFQLGNEELITSTDASHLSYTAGLIVLDLNQIGAPDPSSADGVDRDWLWLHHGSLRTEINPKVFFNDTAGVTGTVARADSTGSSWERVVIDSKAMRRLKPFEELRLVVVLNQIALAPSLEWNFLVRTLVKE